MQLEQILKTYYKKFKPQIKAIEEREFGFGFEKKIDYRHYTFKSEEQLRSFLELKTPKYASYSCAYYEAPEAKPVEAKGYKKGELIFDIDRKYSQEKHEENDVTYLHNDYYCEYCIKRNAIEFIKLIEEILVKDFGINENDMTINFSGSKGFHCHVENDKVTQLSPNARKKIVEYVNGITTDNIFEKNKINGTNFWKRLFEKILYECIANEVAAANVMGRIKNEFLENKEEIKRLFEENKIISEKYKDKILDYMKQYAIEVDAQVTIDKSRLIRIPDTIHGDTGLIAKTITKQELLEFNPGKQAIILNEEASINMIEDTSITFAAKNYYLEKNKDYDIPKSLGLILELKNKGTIKEVS